MDKNRLDKTPGQTPSEQLRENLVVGRPQLEGQTKESARRDDAAAAWLLYGHMFLLCGARPYVCIGWLWAWGSAICFYYLPVGHMFLLCVCMCICVCVYVYMYVCVYICVCM